ncbi:putative cell wall protein [Cucumis melo var. makuwa]|uniref:Cell wall protein n=1 Tax=Cucumis melo var. makuwa TaxID=1194695 RepID=A0A5D3BC54_CUCMM|nr:putative cell wall protein [Cucumis melo var. makuwa]TYJ96609.1 putative cell wall protein [Cucumis melo var. makuwa]
MAHRITPSLFPIFLVILAMTGEAVAARDFPESVLIPGIGRITLSPYDKGSHGGGHSSSYGSNPAPKRQYIPGGDDNFIPNPGYEVPIPANIGGVKETSYP